MILETYPILPTACLEIKSLVCSVTVCSSPSAGVLNAPCTKGLIFFHHWGFELFISAEVTVTVK